MPKNNLPTLSTPPTEAELRLLAGSRYAFTTLATHYGEEIAIQVGILRDPDNPELTADDIAAMRPAREVLPACRRRGRGKQKAPVKVPVSLRLDADLVERFRASGAGWQTRLNTLLRKAVFGEEKR